MTQLEQVKSHLIERGSITCREAWNEYDIQRASEYIRQLREMWGEHTIETVYEKSRNGKTYGRYILKRELTLF